MKFRHMLVHGLNDLRANKLRHFLVGVSMLLGVLAIAAVSSADQLVTKYLIAEQEQLHGRAQTFASVLNPGTLDAEDLADSLEHLNTVAESVGGNVLYTVSSPITVPSVRGQNIERVAYTGDFAASYRVPLSAGIWPRESGGFAPEVVLNEQAAAQLGIDEVAQTFAIDTPHGTKTAIVTGIAQDGLVGEEARIYQPQGSVDDAGLLSSEPTTMLLTAPGDKQIALQQFAADFLTQRGNESAGSMEFMRQDTVDSTKNSVAVTKAAFLTAGILTLIVAAVGVLNVGLATVGERSEELVIRRALGATKVQIFGLVMGSSMIIGAVVAVISAVIVSVSAVFVVPRFMGTTGLVGGIDLPFGALWFGLAAALITSFLGALSPAIKATKLDVAQALRT